MRLTEKSEKTLIITVVSVMVFSLILAVMMPIGIMRDIFGGIFLADMAFIVFGIPILMLWPDDEEDRKFIRRKLFWWKDREE